MRMSEQLALVNLYRQSAPVDVKGLALALGVPVQEAWLDDHICGTLERTPRGFMIRVNAAHPETRKRFTIAHELGHFIFHRHLIGEGLDDDRAFRSTQKGVYKNMAIGPRQETEANKFAANVLMPYDLIEEARREGVNSPQAIARRLGVSERALCIRTGEDYQPGLF